MNPAQRPVRIDPSLARQQLAQLLREEGLNLERLQRLLTEEHGLLQGNDVAALEKTCNARQDCVAELLKVDDERRSLCRMLGFATDAEGLLQLMGWCDTARTLQSGWTDCMQKAAQCRQLNERNGALVAAKLKRVAGLLGMLTGRDSTAAVYGARGDYSRAPVRHALARA